MRVNVQVTAGPASGRQVSFGAGHVVRVGRSEAAELTVSEDATLSEFHFSLTCDSRDCHLRALDDSVQTQVNGKRVVRAVLHEGDRIVAGQTTFSLSRAIADDTPVVPAVERPTGGAEARAPVPLVPASARLPELYRDLQLSEEARPLFEAEQPPDEYVDLLIGRELFADAIRVVARRLTKRAAVKWAIRCLLGVRAGELPPEQAGALIAAEQWAAEPTESNRRAAHEAAELAEFNGAASWIAMAVFWSGGSLAPVEQVEVPPGDGLTARAVSTALTLSAVDGDPNKAVERYLSFLADGKKVLLEEQR